MKLPTFRPPQLATLAAEVPRSDKWLFEFKYDGYRCQAAIAGDQVRLYSRRGHDWSEQFRRVVPPLKELTKGTLLLDGEVCAIDIEGHTNFSQLKTSFTSGAPLTFFAFDILERDGRDLAKLPQLERKQILEAIIGERQEDSPLRYSTHIVGHGADVLKAMCAGGHEGVVAKDPAAPYHAGARSFSWIKVKCIKRQEFVVVGWRTPEDGTEGMRALVLATYEDGVLVPRGRVGTGFTDKQRDQILRLLKPLQVERTPLPKVPADLRRFVRWVEPVLIAEVAYSEITPDGSLRHPSFQGMREDKSAADVTLEKPVDAAETR